MFCRAIGLLALGLSLATGIDSAAADGPVVLRRGNGAEPASLDPFQIGAHWEWNIVGDLFLGLMTEDANGKPMPGAAESWNVSADGLVWTFKLHPGLVWSDGVPLKASDFVAAFRHLLDPKTAAQYASIQYVIKKAQAVNAGKVPVEQLGVRAIDEHTLEFTLESPTPFFLGLLTHWTAYPLPEHAFKKHGAAWIRPGTMVSNGAYTLAHWKAHEEVKLVKNPLFYDAKNVAIDEVYFYPTDDQTAALNRFRAGELDVNLGTRAFTSGQYKWLQENLPGQAHIFPQLGSEYIVLNTRKAPFNDARVRRAVSLCLDRDVLTGKVLRDGQVPAYTFVPPGIDNYRNQAQLDFARQPMEVRRGEARKLLAAAGYGATKPFTFDYMYMISIDSRRSVVAQAAMLKECGIVVRLIGNEPKIHYDSVRQADFTAAQARWGADYNDPQTFLYLLDSRTTVYNYGGYANAAFDRLLDQSKVTLDLNARAGILAEAEQIALDDGPIVPLSFFVSKSLVAPHVKGITSNAIDVNRTRWIRIEKP